MKFSFKNKITAAILAACLLFLLVGIPSYASDSGTCGTDVTWSLQGGILTISGSGAMNNYEDNNQVPWAASRSSIHTIRIEEGITKIGADAFYGCTSVKSVRLPDTVTHIEEKAFAGCTKLSMIILNEGLLEIDDNAFYGCGSLHSIRFPSTLIRIGYQAFSRCISLSSVRVPHNVSNMDASVFAYCTGLLQASVECGFTKLPDWTFYGCTSLVKVSLPTYMQEVGEYAFFKCDAIENIYSSTTESGRDKLTEQIKQDVEHLEEVEEGGSYDIGSTNSETTEEKSDGTVVEVNKEVFDSEHVVVDVVVEHEIPEDKEDNYKITVDATLEDEEGWEDVLNGIDTAVTFPERYEDEDTSVDKIQVNLHLMQDIEIPAELLNILAGKETILTLHWDNNTSVSINCETVTTESLKRTYNLKFTITKNENPTKDQKELIGESESYLIKFEESIPFEVSVNIPMGEPYAGHYASLYHKPILKGWSFLQSVTIDDAGIISFYVNSVDSQTDYLFAIDVEGVSAQNALIPDSMAGQYEGLVDENGTKYVVTGTKSAWGINIMQLTLIIGAVILVSIIIVGVVVKMQFKTAAYKAKLKKEYEEDK